MTETGDWMKDHERNDPRLDAIRAVLDEDGGANWSSKVPRISRILDCAYADADEIARLVPVDEVRCMNGSAKRHTLRMVAIIKALKAAAVNGQLPASVEPLPFVKIARAIVDHWPAEEVPRG